MSEPNCINLKATFGDRFKVEFEEAYYTETVDRPTEAPCLMTIPCQRGHIYPHSGGILSAYSGKSGTRKRLMEMDCCTIHRLGDTEITANFDVADFGKVAEVMKPRKKRRLSDSQRRAQIERLKVHRFMPGQVAENKAVNGPKTGQISIAD